jgi:pyranose oxidase
MKSERVDVDVLIIGSGPVGATFARLLAEGLPNAKILMVDAGPKLTRRAGMHVQNISDRAERLRAQFLSQGKSFQSSRVATLSQKGRALERSGIHPGTSLLFPDGGSQSDMPAASMSTNVGGMGVHWTCACPRPGNSERIRFIGTSEWHNLCAAAESLLHVTTSAFPSSDLAWAIVSELGAVFNHRFPADRQVGRMPLACTVTESNRLYWSGPDVILGPLATPECAPPNFELRSESLCLRLIVGDNGITDSVVRYLPTYSTERVRARVYVVAGDALRTPQLLWASEIRNKALGHFLNDQPQVVGALQMSDEILRRTVCNRTKHALRPNKLDTRDAVVGVFWIPFDDPEHPFHGQLMHFRRAPYLTSPRYKDCEDGYIGLGWYCRKDIRYDDCLEFTDRETDQYGMPKMCIHYTLTENDTNALRSAEKEMQLVANTLGFFLKNGEPRVLPAGSSLHYQGTIRMGETDDGKSVCDTFGQVWGIPNLFVGGNGAIPGATACNPTLTSVALAIRSCARIRALLE